MTPSSQDKQVDHTRSRQQVAVVDPVEVGTGTHHGKAVAAAAVVVAAVVDAYRVDILMEQQVVDGHMLVLVAVDGGNKVVFEGGDPKSSFVQKEVHTKHVVPAASQKS
ncbi:hypothetical protein Tco_0988551 [Tanacetum coccineum]|uniref:Uncharacterized protein n=1 Tax=Tanacetum coccineum TaxID=301880 RepID=A0ABQ5ERV3_9ASTR